jgi:hypothetical protein
MKKGLEVPPDLAHLVEKRDKPDRRAPADAQNQPDQKSQKPAVERRRGDRRKS